MKHGSFFSGIGGFDLATEMMGWENVFHCEIEEYKRNVLKRNFKDSISYEDITNFDGTKYRNTIDIVSGGFPCQDVSISQTSKKVKEKGIRGQRTGLWSEYARVIGEIRPSFIIFENSPMLLSRGFEVILCDLSKLGYNVEWRLFYASQFGFPHLRERLFGIAYASGIGCENIVKKGGILQKVLPKQAPRQSPLPIPTTRFHGKSSYENVRMDDGFSKELDKRLIHGFGNAIIPSIAYSIFYELEQELIKINYSYKQ